MEAMPLEMWGHLLSAWQAKEWRRRYPAAIVAAELRNVNGGKNGQPYTPEDIIGPSPDEDPHERLRKEEEAVAARFASAIKPNGTS